MTLTRHALLIVARTYYRERRDDLRLAKTSRNLAATLLSAVETELEEMERSFNDRVDLARCA